MHRILPIVLFAVTAALGIASCAGTGTQPSSEASPAALNYDLPDNTVMDEKD